MSVECEYCAGKLDKNLVCTEPDCRGDMRTHWEMTNPQMIAVALRYQIVEIVDQPETQQSAEIYRFSNGKLAICSGL